MLRDILLIDDDGALNQLLQRLVETAKFVYSDQGKLRVWICQSIEEANAFIKTQPVDVIVLDLSFPGWPPDRTCAEIPELIKRWGKPIIVLTGQEIVVKGIREEVLARLGPSGDFATKDLCISQPGCLIERCINANLKAKLFPCLTDKT